MAIVVQILIFDPDTARVQIEHDEKVHGLRLHTDGPHDPILDRKCGQLGQAIYDTIIADVVGETAH